MSEHELWNELGNLYFMSGARPQAVHAYHRSIQMDQNYGRPYSNLALMYAQDGESALAVRLFQKSLELLTEDREKAISWNRLGNLYRQARSYDQALIAFQRADDLDPECKEGREAMGQLLYATSDLTILERAHRIRESADESLEPTAAGADSALANLGWGDFEWEVPDPGVPDGEEPGSVEAAWMTPWVEPQLDQATEDSMPRPSDEGEHSFEQAAEEQDEDVVDVTKKYTLSFPPPPINGRGQREEAPQRSNQAVAVEVLQRPLPIVTPALPPELKPVELVRDSGAGESSIAASTSAAGNNPGSETELARLKRMVQINPRNAVAWDSLGSLHKSAGRFRDAILAFQQAISIDAGRADYHHHLGLVYAIDGQSENAMHSFQKVLDLAPDHSLAHATLGGYYRKMGLDELAQKHIGKAMRNIYDSESEYNRACLKAICGDVDEAIALLRIALANRQTYAEWVIHDPDLDFIRDDPRFKQLVSDFAR